MVSITYILYRLTDILRRILHWVNFTANNSITAFLYLGYIDTGILFPQVILRAITDMEGLGAIFTHGYYGLFHLRS